jgi:hypothetical protein
MYTRDGGMEHRRLISLSLVPQLAPKLVLGAFFFSRHVIE